MKLSPAVCLIGLGFMPLYGHAFSFTPGDYYASTGSSIEQFSPDGQLLGSLTSGSGPISAGSGRGIAFGADGLLYIVRDGSVDAMNADGQVVKSYTFPGWIDGNISEGNITFSNDGSTFYVSAADGIYKFNSKSLQGSLLTAAPSYQIAMEPNGNFFSVSEYSISEYSASGSLLSSSPPEIADPKGLTTAFNDWPGVILTDLRGIAFDPSTNTLYTTMLGYSGGTKTSMTFKLMALDATTYDLKAITNYWYGSGLSWTSAGVLLAGSRTLAPQSFGADLSSIATLGSLPAMFVTSMPVPEPSAYDYEFLGLGVLGVVALRGMTGDRRQRTSRSPCSLAAKLSVD